jgi:hypothetical protein
MMHFQQIPGATIGQTLEKGGLPQRTGAVERCHRNLLGGGQHVGEGRTVGESHAPHVIVQVEIGIYDPCWDADAQRRLDHPLPEPRHEPRCPFMRGQEPVPLRRHVELLQRAYCRAQPRISFGAPHQCLERAHLTLAAPVQRTVLSTQHSEGRLFVGDSHVRHQLLLGFYVRRQANPRESR